MKQKILQLKSQGKSYDEICAILGCAKSTVSYHLNPKTKEGYIRRQNDRRRDSKQKLVELFGGKCSVCGYDKSISALQFHHKNPKEKHLIIKDIIGNFEKAKKEAMKCVLVCSNCHFEIHDKLRLED